MLIFCQVFQFYGFLANRRIKVSQGDFNLKQATNSCWEDGMDSDCSKTEAEEVLGFALTDDQWNEIKNKLDEMEESEAAKDDDNEEDDREDDLDDEDWDDEDFGDDDDDGYDPDNDSSDDLG